MISKFSKNIGNIKKLDTSEVSEVLADKKVLNNLSKLAKDISRVSPHSDEFLYFSIVFL